MHRITAGAAGLLMLAASPAAQPTFRAQTELVAMTVRVHDRQGRFVTGLAADRFVVTERGRRRPIAILSDDAEPLSLVLAIDASESMRGERWAFATQAVLTLFAAQRARDEFHVLGFNDRVFPIAPGTQSIATLRAALSRVEPYGATALYDTVITALGTLRSTRNRRQAVVVLSDGRDFLPRDARDSNRAAGAMLRARRAYDAAQRSPAAVHAIAIEPFATDGRQEPADPAGLPQIADTSGGSFYVVREDRRIPEAAARVLRDLREQYLIGFEPAFSGDNRFHSVDVSVTGCDCRVVVRDGYYSATRPGAR